MRYALLALLLVLPAAHSVQASGLGRLFFTPEQRVQLEQERKAIAEDGPPSSVLTVNGIVQRKGGVRTVWINGVAQNAGNSDEQSPEALPVPVPGQSKPVKMKVGQKIILDQPVQYSPAPTPQEQPAPGK